MTQYIADEAHFKEVIARVPKVKRSLWIGTADIKDLYVEERPFLGLLADRMLHMSNRIGPCVILKRILIRNKMESSVSESS
jgi:hypothetical protein